MPTEAKAALIEELTEKMQKSSLAILVQTQGLTVAEISELRRKIRQSNGELKVAKNTLLRIATERANMDGGLGALFNGQTTVAFGYDDPIAIAKAVTDYLKQSKVVTLKAAIFEGRSISAKEVEILAATPPMPVVQAELVGAIQGPLNSMVSLVTAPLRDLVYVLQARADQLGGANA